MEQQPDNSEVSSGPPVNAKETVRRGIETLSEDLRKLAALQPGDAIASMLVSSRVMAVAAGRLDRLERMHARIRLVLKDPVNGRSFLKATAALRRITNIVNEANQQLTKAELDPTQRPDSEA
jgi:hypothetical protein